MDECQESQAPDRLQHHVEVVPRLAVVGVLAEEGAAEVDELGRDAPLEGRDLLAQLGVGAGGDPEFHRGFEERALVDVPDVVEGVAHPVVGVLERHEAARHELVGALLGQVLDGREDQFVLGGEVVDLGASGHAGALHHAGGGRPVVTVLHQALDGGVEERPPCGGGALLLGAAGDGHAINIQGGLYLSL